MPEREDARNNKQSMPLIVINGYPGVGKYSTAICLGSRISDSRVIDNHLLIDPVAALLERDDEGYQDFRKSIREPVLKELATNDRLRQRTIIATHYQQVKQKGRLVEIHEFLRSADAGNRPFISIILQCNEEENVRRLISRPKSSKTKLTDARVLHDLRGKHVLYSFENDADVVPKIALELRVDVELISAEDAADKIIEFLKSNSVQLTSKKNDTIRK